MLQSRVIGTCVAILTILPLVAVESRAQAQKDPFLHLASALFELREGKAELKAERFALHREKAIVEIDLAISETETAIQDAKIELRKFEAPRNPKEYYKNYRDFPHLRHALVELAEAKREIEREKRGNFSRAVKAIDVAMVRVVEALKDSK
jgi:hypothetical protein